MRRVIRKVPVSSLEIVPAGAVLVDGHLDYLTEETAPADALYLAEQDEATKVVTVARDNTGGTGIQAHTFAGWPQPIAAREYVPPVVAEIK